MVRKSKTKDPRKPSLGYLKSIGAPTTPAPTAKQEKAEVVRQGISRQFHLGVPLNDGGASVAAAKAANTKPEDKEKAERDARNKLKGVQASGSNSNGKSKNKEVLRQVIQDLGGDEEDYIMLEGVDTDDEEEVEVVKQAKGKGKEKEKAGTGAGGVVNEAKLKTDLSSFLSTLDFSAFSGEAAGGGVVEETEVGDVAGSDEEESDSEEDEDDDEDEQDDEDDEDDEDEDEEEEESSEDEQVVIQPKSVAVEVKKVKEDGPSKDGQVDYIPEEPLWYKIPLPPLPTTSSELSTDPLPQFRLAALQSRANTLLTTFRASTSTASKSKAKGGNSKTDAAFIAQILSDGTHQDKLSALILLVRESPLHRMEELERLRVMAGGVKAGGEDEAQRNVKGGGGREERMAVLRALVDWWISGGGKEVGKLRYFTDQPAFRVSGAVENLSDRHLLLFAFEDWLKKWFFSVLQLLETYSHDTLPFVRTQSLQMIFRLLSGNAEQEQNLLRLGVNKLGDNDKGVASKASHLILMLLQAHPQMKGFVVREVSTLVLRPTASGTAPASKHVKFGQDKGASGGKNAKTQVEAGVDHARYYGVITLNQITLAPGDKEVAGRLVEVFFEIFRELLGVTDDDKPLAGPSETGIPEAITGKVHKFQGRRKGTKFSKGKDKDKEDGEIEQDDAKLMAGVLTGVTRALPFAKLDEEVFEKHAETLFKVTHTGTFNISIRALSLLHQISASKETVSDRFYRTLYESLLDPRLTTTNKQAMYLNLLFKAIKSDKSSSRVMAFVKRLLQVMTMHQPPFICGALYLLGELFSLTPGLSELITDPEDDPKEVDESVKRAVDDHDYDGKKRDPNHANAERSCLWELLPFTRHFHPSVSLQASQLMALQLPLTGSADITQNTLISFLDKFVYRNPKKSASAKGASIMQPAAITGRNGSTITQNKGAATAADANAYVNEEKFWKLQSKDVPADQLFFHKYFNAKIDKQKAIDKSKKRKGKDGEEVDSELESVVEDDEEVAGSADEAGDVDEEDSDPEEAEVWKAMQASMPQTNADEDLMEDSEDEELDISDREEEDSDDAEAAPVKSAFGPEDDEVEEDSDDDSDGFPMEDEDDLLDLEDMEDIDLPGMEGGSDEESEEDEATLATKKRKREGDERKERKKKRKALPLLASADDYAALIDGAEEENV